MRSLGGVTLIVVCVIMMGFIWSIVVAYSWWIGGHGEGGWFEVTRDRLEEILRISYEAQTLMLFLKALVEIYGH